MRLARFLSPLAALLCTTFACVSDTPVDALDGGTPSPQHDSAVMPSQESSVSCSGGPTCSDPSTLQTCASGTLQKTTCPLGCSATDTPHCAIFQPNAPVLASDLATQGVTDITISVTGFLNTLTGAIDNVRPANKNPATFEIQSGIGFRVVGTVGIFVFQNLTIADGIVLKARGSNAVAVVATQKIVLKGIFDARGYDADGTLCKVSDAGPGGGAGGAQVNNQGADGKGSNPGKGTGIYTSTAGPGGGGFGAVGGDGGGFPGSGGATSLMPVPIAGGSGGGGALSYDGGGGGGGVQFVAGQQIDIGGGSNPGGINAGGCGGKGGIFGSTGGGGGSGGAIVVQSLIVNVLAQGAAAANGGAGSTGNGSRDGDPGQLSASAATGPLAISGYGAAGVGGAGSNYAGGAAGAGSGNPGGGGGGSVGRIRIENQSGTLTLPAGAVVSPTISTTAGAPATVGTITTQ